MNFSRIKTFLPYLLAYKKEVSIGIAALVVTDMLTLVIPWLLKLVIDLLPQKPSGMELAKYSGFLILTAMVLGVGRFGWRKYLFGPSRKIEADIINQLFYQFQTLDRSWFQSQKIGDLVSRATNDLRSVKDFLGLGLLIFIDAVVVIVAAVSLMLFINPTLTLYCLMPLPVISIMFFGFIHHIHQRHLAIQEHLGKITTMVQENLAGIRVLHAFVQEEYEKSKFDELNQEHIKRNLSLAKLFGVFTPSLVFVIGVSAMISLWLGGKAVIANEMTLGSFVAFNGYLMLLSWPMMAVGYIINITQRGLTAMGRLQEIFNARSSLKRVEVPEEADQPDLKGAIVFKNVSFKYPESEALAVNSIDLEIPVGSRVAIVGKVGSGKSSLAQLIPRMFDPTEGDLSIGGRSIATFRLEHLRSAIGYVEQEPFLFSTSIRDNILLSRPESSEEDINKVVRWAGLLPDLERWPEGLDTIVGERGVSLSGGQKQRIALARALLRRPPILILDDAFSSLDVETERGILKAIRDEVEDMTLIVVTHRLSVARDVDRVVVMDDGKIISEGTHEQLMKEEGVYRQMYLNQSLAQEMEITLK